MGRGEVSAWGGYVFIINLIPLHVFVLLLMGRFSWRIYVAYSTFFILGLILSMQVPFVGFQPIRTSEHMASVGVFGLLNAYGALLFIQSLVSKRHFRYFFFFTLSAVTAFGFSAIVLLTYLGWIAPWSGRFYSLWDTGYAKIHIPIISSVSEHQPTTWVSFFFDLHVLITMFPVGAWYCMKNINEERVFILLYAITAVYFAGVMIRLMLTLTPVVCMLAGIAFSYTYERYLRDSVPDKSAGLLPAATRQKSSTIVASDDSNGGNKNMYDKAGKLRKPPKIESAEAKEQAAAAAAAATEEQDLGINVKSIVSIVLVMLLLMFAIHCTWVTSNAYSSPSVVLASYHSDGSRIILDDFREAYYWLRQNTPDKARIMSWWDYGYQIAGMGNRTTLVDNNTWNNSHIALVGKAMSSTEEKAYEIMQDLDVDYVLVIFGGLIGYSGDDINKFLWMVRIAQGEHPKDIHESDYFTVDGDFRVDSGGSKTLLNCLMYKLSYYRFGEVQTELRTPPGFDRTRGTEIGNKHFALNYMEEAYTTENWLVRIYKVKKPENRVMLKYAQRKVKRPSHIRYGKVSQLLCLWDIIISKCISEWPKRKGSNKEPAKSRLRETAEF
ncbi:unnamed protein product [Soboliphyme baturini]|uniref:dolichyl-diphosphooligosaccharide--protein glycotransferase n=1 Tax=Soboliphyme baturini TaxID=241478 RepID=A0A183IEZ6_9BILA|nr:unnamed protein product [Soboliphyme baturini]